MPKKPTWPPWGSANSNSVDGGPLLVMVPQSPSPSSSSTLFSVYSTCSASGAADGFRCASASTYLWAMPSRHSRVHAPPLFSVAPAKPSTNDAVTPTTSLVFTHAPRRIAIPHYYGRHRLSVRIGPLT